MVSPQTLIRTQHCYSLVLTVQGKQISKTESVSTLAEFAILLSILL